MLNNCTIESLPVAVLIGGTANEWCTIALSGPEFSVSREREEKKWTISAAIYRNEASSTAL